MSLSSGDRLLPVQSTDIPVIFPQAMTPPASAGDRFILVRGADGVHLAALVTAVDTSGQRGIPAMLADGKPCLVQFGSVAYLLYGWGENSAGEIGDGTTADKTVAVAVALEGIESVYYDALEDKSYFLSADKTFYETNSTSPYLPTEVDFSSWMADSVALMPKHFMESASIAVLYFNDGKYRLGTSILSGADNPTKYGSFQNTAIAGFSIGATSGLHTSRYADNLNGFCSSGHGTNDPTFSRSMFAIPAAFSMPRIVDYQMTKYVYACSSYAVGADGSLWVWGLNVLSAAAKTGRLCLGFGSPVDRSGSYTNRSGASNDVGPHTPYVINTPVPTIETAVAISDVGVVLSNGTVIDVLNRTFPVQKTKLIKVASADHLGIITTDGEARTNDGEVVPFINKVAKTNGKHFLLSTATTGPENVFSLWALVYDIDTTSWAVQYAGTTYTEIADWEQHGANWYKTTAQTFSGTGTDNFFFYSTGGVGDDYRFQVRQWRTSLKLYYSDDGVSWTGPYDISTTLQTVDVFKFVFAGTSGHDLGDTWFAPAIPDPPSSLPDAPTVYYYWQSIYEVTDDVETGTDGGWTTPTLSGKSTFGKEHDWVNESYGVASKCTTSASAPSAPTSTPTMSYNWVATYDCEWAAWTVVPANPRRQFAGTFYYDTNYHGSPSDYWHIYDRFGTPITTWTEVADGVWWITTNEGDDPPITAPSPPAVTPTCYYYWEAYYDCWGGEWYVFLFDILSSGPAYDWDCYEDPYSGDYCTCITTSATEPAAPDYTPECL